MQRLNHVDLSLELEPTNPSQRRLAMAYVMK